jgi:hypothetical protein
VKFIRTWIIFLLDVILSILIAFVCFAIFIRYSGMAPLFFEKLESLSEPSVVNWMLIVIIAGLLSSLFASIWTVLLVVASALLRGLSPIRRLMTWFFDVEKKPLQAVGIVAAALILVGALGSTIVRALI